MESLSLGKRLRQAHLQAVSPADKVRLNFTEARALYRVNPEYAWTRFVKHWRRRFERQNGSD